MSQTTLLGKVVITPRGNYDPAVAYVPLDVVTYQGSSYLVRQDVQGIAPIDAVLSYQLLAKKGDDGSGTGGGSAPLDLSEYAKLDGATFTGQIQASNLSGYNTGDQVNISGNAGTATKLQTARNINGQPFDGTQDISITGSVANLAAISLLGNSTNAPGAPGAISLGTNLSFAGNVLNAAATVAKFAQTSGVGDIGIDNAIFIAIGDSTTEQMGTGNADVQFARYRQAGGPLNPLAGMINFGSSGNQLANFVAADADATFVGPTLGANLGSGNWDSWFHKPTGAVNLKTAMAWRSAYTNRVVWMFCYGINDLILRPTGTLTHDQIVATLLPLAQQVIESIQAAHPQDQIILRMPNPMTARPYDSNAGFPSATQYPNFGQNDANDQALVEVWNQSLRSTYLALQDQYPRTVLLDTWQEVFGPSNTTLPAITSQPWLANLVHPQAAGYNAIADRAVQIMAPNYIVPDSRKAEADARAPLVSLNPWDIYPAYFDTDPLYKLALGNVRLIGVGATFIDLVVPLATFQSRVPNGAAFYVEVQGVVTQGFSGGYTVAANGSNTRVYGITVNALMQAQVGASVNVWVASTTSLIGGDPFINTQVIQKARAYYTGKISSAVNGSFKLYADGVPGHMSSLFPDGVPLASLYGGGTKNGNVSLAGATAVISPGSTPLQRTIYVTLPGTDFTSYNNQPGAIIWGETSPGPTAYESHQISGTTSATAGTELALAHGLGYTPLRVVLTPTGNGNVYRSKASDATSIYVKSGAASITFDATVW